MIREVVVQKSYKLKNVCLTCFFSSPTQPWLPQPSAAGVVQVPAGDRDRAGWLEGRREGEVGSADVCDSAARGEYDYSTLGAHVASTLQGVRWRRY